MERVMKHSRLLRYSIVGFAVGTLLSTAYLLFGSWGLFYRPKPLWARILFFPGVAAGHLIYEAGLYCIPACQAVGVGSMGVVAAIIGLATAIIFNKRKAGRI
jgi:uncharacterized membrane protein